MVGQLRFQNALQDGFLQAGQQAFGAEDVLGLVAVLKQLIKDFIRYVFHGCVYFLCIGFTIHLHSLSDRLAGLAGQRPARVPPAGPGRGRLRHRRRERRTGLGRAAALGPGPVQRHRVRCFPAGRRGASGGCGIRLRSGFAVTTRNVIVQGFASGAIALRDNAEALFLDGTSSIAGDILPAAAGRVGGATADARLEELVSFRQVDPRLVGAARRPNPDPRPRLNSPALQVGAAAVPPSDGLLDTGAQYVGAFGDSNWFEEWTFFGPEAHYRVPAAVAGEGGG